jgi:copper chaperone CopZ
MSTERVTLAIYGLSCGGGGALTVERALARLKGVRSAYVNPATEVAYVEYDPAIADAADLVRAVANAGFRSGELTRR